MVDAWTTMRGHKVYHHSEDDTWRYGDGAIADDTRACTECFVMHEERGPDPCLGRLPGVDFACCGHGDPYYEYVKTPNNYYESVEEWHEASTVG